MKVNKAESKKTAIQLLKYGVIGASNTMITAISFCAQLTAQRCIRARQCGWLCARRYQQFHLESQLGV